MVRVGQIAPRLDMAADLVDDRRRVVFLLLGREARLVCKKQLRLTPRLTALLRLRDRRDRSDRRRASMRRLVGCPSASSSQCRPGYSYGELRIGRSKNCCSMCVCPVDKLRIPTHPVLGGRAKINAGCRQSSRLRLRRLGKGVNWLCCPAFAAGMRAPRSFLPNRSALDRFVTQLLELEQNGEQALQLAVEVCTWSRRSACRGGRLVRRLGSGARAPCGRTGALRRWMRLFQ